MLTCIYLCRTLLFFAPYADFFRKKSLTILLLLLVLLGGLFAYVKMGKLEDAPFTIK